MPVGVESGHRGKAGFVTTTKQRLPLNDEELDVLLRVVVKFADGALHGDAVAVGRKPWVADCCQSRSRTL